MAIALPKINVLKLGTWVIGHFATLIALVQQTVHLVEQAPNETVAKREQAITQIMGQLSSAFDFVSVAERIVKGLIGFMVENYVGWMNLTHGHDWYGSVGSANATPQIADAAGPVAQATQLIRQTNVDAPSAPATDPAGTPAPSAPTDTQTTQAEAGGANYPTGAGTNGGGGSSQ